MFREQAKIITLRKLSEEFLHCTYDTIKFIGKSLSGKCQQLCASKWNILQLLGNGSDLFHPVLVSSQVALKSFMFPQQSPDLYQGSSFIILLLQNLLFAW